MYTTYSQDVVRIIEESHNYLSVIFELRVDGTGYCIIQYYNEQYYQDIFTVEEMKQSPVIRATEIILSVESFFRQKKFNNN